MKLSGICAFRSCERQPDVKHSAGAGLVVCPDSTPMSFDDGSRQVQAHPHTLGLGRKKWLKHYFGFIDWYATAGI
jgi:hypothetical protein